MLFLKKKCFHLFWGRKSFKLSYLTKSDKVFIIEMFLMVINSQGPIDVIVIGLLMNCCTISASLNIPTMYTE